MKHLGILTLVLMIALLGVQTVPPVGAACAAGETQTWLNQTAYNTGSPYWSGAEDTFANVQLKNGNGDNGDTLILYLKSGTTNNKFIELDRSITIYDTSSIPDTATIDYAELTGVCDARAEGLGTPDFGVTSGTVDDVDAIDQDDFQNFDTDVLSGYISPDNGEYFQLPLNADGKTYIDKTGKTILFQRFKWDILDNFDGVWGNTKTAEFDISFDKTDIWLNVSYCEPVPIPDPFPGDHLSCSVNKTGDNFIWWWWGNSTMESAPNLTKTVFVDNYKVVDNTTMTYYVLTDVNPDEKHVLELWGFNQTLNTLNTTTVCTDKTYEQDIWTLLYIGIALLVIGWFTAPVLILASIPVFLLGFGMALDMTTQSYIILTYGIGFVFSMITFVLRWTY